MKTRGKDSLDILQQSLSWWTVRAWVIATDRGKYIGPLNLLDRISMLRN